MIELEIGKEYIFDGQFVKLIRIDGEYAHVETRFGSVLICELSELEENRDD